MSNDEMPDGISIEELAEFWNTHDATDYWDEFEEVIEPVFASEVRVSRPALSEEEIDESVIAEADDDSAWEGPSRVKPERFSFSPLIRRTCRGAGIAEPKE